jgi:hypothetical protein
LLEHLNSEGANRRPDEFCVLIYTVIVFCSAKALPLCLLHADRFGSDRRNRFGGRFQDGKKLFVSRANPLKTFSPMTLQHVIKEGKHGVQAIP